MRLVKVYTPYICWFMPKKVFLSFRVIHLSVLLLAVGQCFGQCPTASMTLPSSACVDDTISPTVGGSFDVYEWDFSPGDLDEIPTATNLGNIGSSLASARNISIVKDGSTWYGFVNHLSAATVYRLDFGNSLENTPTIAQLLFTATNSNPGTSSSKIRFRKEGNYWYGIQVTDQKRLLIYNFGNSLANNNITATCHINPLGLFTSPRDVVIAEQNDSVFALVMNYSPDNISILRFGSSISNTPFSGYNETIIESSSLLNNSSCFALAKYCDDWIVFAASPATDNIARINLGPYFNGNASGVLLFSSATVTDPQQIELISENGKWYGFYKSSSGGGTTKLDFGTNLLSTPTSFSYSNFSGLTSGAQALSIELANDSSNWYAFITNYQSANERLIRLDFPNELGGDNWSTSPTPNVLASSAGTIHVAFRGIDASGNTSFASDSILVHSTAIPNFGFDGLCENVATNFTDSSTSVDTISNWLWNFGNGDSSQLTSPTVTYANAGNYTVSLTLTTSNGCVSSSSEIIEIFPEPQVSFSIDTACAKETLIIIDTSTAGNDSISSRFWLFDSDTSTANNPIYSFNTYGLKSIMLAIESSHGCVDTGYQSVYIKETPEVAFDLDFTCLGDTTLFTNTCTFGSGSMDFSWQFGDGGTSSQNHPNHIYAAIGSYTSQLLVEGSNGCKDSLFAPVVVSVEPIVAFSSENNPVCHNNAIVWHDNSSVSSGNIIAWEWDFGNGIESNLQHPEMQYDQEGQYTVSLRAYSGTKCSNIDSASIPVLESPTMVLDIRANCENQQTLFRDLSLPATTDSIVGWNWVVNADTIGNDSIATATFNQVGETSLRLTITSALGCNLSLDSIFTLRQRPVVEIVHSSGLMCTDLDLKFKSVSEADSADSVNTYLWRSFSNNQAIDSSDLKNYTFNQSDAGSYVLTTEIETWLGCLASDTAIISLEQAPISIIQSNTACKGDTTYFTDNYTGSNYRWSWYFGDGISIATDDPFHLYQDTGMYQAHLILLDKLSGCYDSTNFLVRVNPQPEPRFSSGPLCASTDIRFRDETLLQNDSIIQTHWDILDVAQSDLSRPVFNFSSSGKFILNYGIETANGCRAQSTEILEIEALPMASFDFEPFVGAPPLMVNLNNTSSTHLNYYWRIGNQDSIYSDSFLFEHEGEYEIELFVNSASGCTSSALRLISIEAVEIDLVVEYFKATNQNGLVEFELAVLNRGNKPIVNPFVRISLNQDKWFLHEFGLTLYPGDRIEPTIQTLLVLEETETIDLACATLIFEESQFDISPDNNISCQTELTSNIFFRPFPNPTADRITLPYFVNLNADPMTLSIFNAQGELMATRHYAKLDEGYGSKSMDVSYLAKGLYYVNATIGSLNQSFKFVKE